MKRLRTSGFRRAVAEDDALILNREYLSPPDRSGSWAGAAKRVTFLLVVAMALTQTGCQMFDRFSRRPAPGPERVNSQMSLDQIIIAMNEQASRVNQLKSEVRVSMDGVPTMRGTVLLERPRRLRLKAGIAGINAIDVGSNNEHFWIWTKAALPGQPPTMMYARHVDFQTSPMRRQIPLDPTWLIDGFGFAEFLPTDRHEGPFVRPDDQRWEIRTWRETPTGQNIRVCVVDPKTANVVQQTWYDQNGQRIGWLNALQYEYDEENDVSLPRRIELFVQDQGLARKLTVDSGDFVVNALYGDPERLWALPNPADVKKVDLSTVGHVAGPGEASTADAEGLRFPRRAPTTGVDAPVFRR